MNQIYDLSSEKTIHSIEELIKTKKVTFLVGSAISSFQPSALPMGMKVVDELVDFFIKDISHRFNLGHLKALKGYIGQAAFEHLLEHYPEHGQLSERLSKAFSQTKPNPAHRALISIAAKSGSPIITTNYDDLLEQSAKEIDIPTNVIINPNKNYSFADGLSIFKIHGSVNQPSSIIARMSEEGRLPRKKEEIFNQLVKGRHVIVIGYSGRDFEICPALNASCMESIWWNVFDISNKSSVSPWLQHMISNDERLRLLVGDMGLLLGTSLEKSEAPPLSPYLLEDLTNIDKNHWRAQFFNSLACPVAAEYITEGLDQNDIVRISTEASNAYRRGKYLSSISLSDRARSYKNLSSVPEQFHRYLDRSFKLRNYGAVIKAIYSYVRAAYFWRELSLTEKKNNLSGLCWSSVLNMKWNKRLKIKRARYLAYWAQKKGRWGQYLNLKIELEQMGIQDDDPLLFTKHTLPVELGYQQIGNISSYIDDYCRYVESSKTKSSEFLLRLYFARSFELYPNAWKCCHSWLKTHPVSALQKRRLIKLSFHFLGKCQYTFLCKVGIITAVIYAAYFSKSQRS